MKIGTRIGGKIDELTTEPAINEGLKTIIAGVQPKDSSDKQAKFFAELDKIVRHYSETELARIFDKTGEPGKNLKIQGIRTNPDFNADSATYRLLEQLEKLKPGVGITIACRINALIIAGVISHVSSQIHRADQAHPAVNGKIGKDLEASKAIIRGLEEPDNLDTELTAFDLHRLKEFLKAHGLSVPNDIDCSKLKAENDALFKVIKESQQYAVADCQFDTALMTELTSNLLPYTESDLKALLEVYFYNPENAKRLKKQVDTQLAQIEALANGIPAPLMAIARHIHRRATELTENQQVRGSSADKFYLANVLTPAFKRFMPGMFGSDYGVTKRKSRAFLEEKPTDLFCRVDKFNGEIYLGNDIDSNALKLILGEGSYEMLRTEILTKLAALVCSKQSLENSFHAINEETFQVTPKSKVGSDPAKIRKPSTKARLLPRLYHRMIAVADETPEKQQRKIPESERSAIAHRRLLPEGFLPSPTALAEAKKNRHPTSPLPPEIFKRPELKNIRIKEGIGKLFAVVWVEENAEGLVEHRINAEQLQKSVNQGETINTVINRELANHRNSSIRFYTYVSEVNPQHIQGQTRSWLNKLLGK